MKFISQLLKVTKNLRVVICCDVDYYNNNYYRVLKRLCAEDIELKRENGFTLKNGGRVNLCKADLIDVYGEHGDVIVTDILPNNDKYQNMILPMLNGRLTGEEKLSKFVYNPLIEEIISNF